METQNKTLEKILLVEDNDLYVESSVFPEGVEVTRVKTYMQAMDELFGRSEYGSRDEEIKNPKGYSYLLTDLNFPRGDSNPTYYQQHEDRQVPQPLGYPLAFIATEIGIPKIGIYTDTNHHQGSMAATSDDLDHLTQEGTRVGNSHLIYWDCRSWIRNEKREQRMKELFQNEEDYEKRVLMKKGEETQVVEFRNKRDRKEEGFQVISPLKQYGQLYAFLATIDSRVEEN